MKRNGHIKRKIAKPLAIRLFEDQLPVLDDICQKDNRKLTNLIRVIVDEYLDQFNTGQTQATN